MSLIEVDRNSLRWQKAARSLHNGECVEIAPVDGGVVVRDSKDPNGPILGYTRAEWRTFLDAAKNGEFDHLAH